VKYERIKLWCFQGWILSLFSTPNTTGRVGTPTFCSQKAICPEQIQVEELIKEHDMLYDVKFRVIQQISGNQSIVCSDIIIDKALQTHRNRPILHTVS
jgi:hypothetical protein